MLNPDLDPSRFRSASASACSRGAAPVETSRSLLAALCRAAARRGRRRGAAVRRRARLLVQNARRARCSPRRERASRCPIASITKLMTVLVALERARRRRRRHGRRARAAASASRRSTCAPGERLTVARPARGGADPERERRRVRARRSTSAARCRAFVALMNAKARALGLRDTHFVRPDGLDAPGHFSSARDVTKLARVAMHEPVRPRDRPPAQSRRRPGGTLHTWNDLLVDASRGLIGVKTGHTNDAGWSQVAAARGRGRDDLRDDPRRPTRSGSATPTSRSCSPGGSRATARSGRSSGTRTYASARTAVRDGRACALVAAKPALRVVRVERPLVERVVAPVAVELPGPAGPARSARCEVLDRGASSSPVAARRAAKRSRAGRHSARVGCYAGRTLHHLRGFVLVIVTVTLNAAIDRTLTVPNFQLGHRHRASAGAHARRRQGDQRRARAQAARRPGRRDRARRRAHRHADRRGADRARRSSTTSSASTASRARRRRSSTRPASSYTEINEWGPEVSSEELEMLLEKLDYLSPRRGLRRLRRLAAARRRRRASTPRRSATSTGAASRPCSTPRASRCGSASRRSRCSSRRTSARPSSVVGQEFDDDEDFVLALDQIAELGARNVLITPESGCFALLREDRQVRRYQALAPQRRAGLDGRLGRRRCSPRSSPRARRASPPRRRCARRSRRAPRRRSRSAPAASTRATPAGSPGGVELESSSRPGRLAGARPRRRGMMPS